jgi:NADPH:quinone reductase-like Zn-dependent oxidoreductase
MRLPERGEHPKFDEWVIVLGGSGSVGQFAVQVSQTVDYSVAQYSIPANATQIAKRCGYKVLATCSPANEAVSLHSITSSPLAAPSS